ncbi:hypothetical protein J6590_048277 [Homalodisca vitripennis]|nr:hypothetical protein J6590_048277 [Homalodisca vitripennis]
MSISIPCNGIYMCAETVLPTASYQVSTIIPQDKLILSQYKIEVPCSKTASYSNSWYAS